MLSLLKIVFLRTINYLLITAWEWRHFDDKLKSLLRIIVMFCLKKSFTFEKLF